MSTNLFNITSLFVFSRPNSRSSRSTSVTRGSRDRGTALPPNPQQCAPAELSAAILSASLRPSTPTRRSATSQKNSTSVNSAEDSSTDISTVTLSANTDAHLATTQESAANHDSKESVRETRGAAAAAAALVIGGNVSKMKGSPVVASTVSGSNINNSSVNVTVSATVATGAVAHPPPVGSAPVATGKEGDLVSDNRRKTRSAAAGETLIFMHPRPPGRHIGIDS